MQRFVLAGMQRAGTSLVNSTLDTHSRIRCYGEVFLYAKGKGRNMPGSYRRFIEARGRTGWLQHYLNRAAMIRRCLDETFDTPGFDAVGFKLMLEQARRHPVITDYLVEHGIKVIFIVRRNVLKTHLSRVTAKQRNLYIVKEKVRVSRAHIETGSLLRELRNINEEARAWRAILGGIPHIVVFYEDVVRNKPAEFARIEDFLHVSHEEPVTPAVKINPDNMQDYVENYDEMAGILRGTEFEQFL